MPPPVKWTTLRLVICARFLGPMPLDSIIRCRFRYPSALKYRHPSLNSVYEFFFLLLIQHNEIHSQHWCTIQHYEALLLLLHSIINYTAIALSSPQWHAMPIPASFANQHRSQLSECFHLHTKHHQIFRFNILNFLSHFFPARCLQIVSFKLSIHFTYSPYIPNDCNTICCHRWTKCVAEDESLMVD